MKFENGQVEMNLVDGLPSLENEPKKEFFTFRIQLPEKLTCKHCVFQFWWRGGNNQLYISKLFYLFVYFFF